MDPSSTTSLLARTIEISIAPVFLLSAVGVFLGVLTNRLSRIVDRRRSLEADAERGGREEELREERRILEQRRHLIALAITACTYSALLIAGVIAALFVGAVVRLDLASLIALAFVAAMGALIVGLTNFLREVRLALRWVRRSREVG